MYIDSIWLLSIKLNNSSQTRHQFYTLILFRFAHGTCWVCFLKSEITDYLNFFFLILFWSWMRHHVAIRISYFEIWREKDLVMDHTCALFYAAIGPLNQIHCQLSTTIWFIDFRVHIEIIDLKWSNECMVCMCVC